MDIFLLRHGTRNFTMGDVPLNDEGLKEAQALSEDIKLSQCTHIYCSPKKRAKMTVEPLSQKTNHPTIIIDGLDQMMSHESEAEFKSRINHFLEKLADHKETDSIIICSHSDWLSLAVEIIATNALDLKHYMFATAEYIHFKVEDGLWKIQER